MEMPKIKKMNARYNKLQVLLKKDLRELISTCEKMDHKTLNWKPSKDEWSIAQVCHHLMLVERLSVAYVQKKLSFNPKLKSAVFTDFWRVGALAIYARYMGRLKAPKAVNENNFPAESQFKEIKKEWQENRMILWDHYRQIPEEHIGKQIYRHPFAGRMSMRGMLVFFHEHFLRHRKQINRILVRIPKDL